MRTQCALQLIAPERDRSQEAPHCLCAAILNSEREGTLRGNWQPLRPAPAKMACVPPAAVRLGVWQQREQLPSSVCRKDWRRGAQDRWPRRRGQRHSAQRKKGDNSGQTEHLMTRRIEAWHVSGSWLVPLLHVSLHTSTRCPLQGLLGPVLRKASL